MESAMEPALAIIVLLLVLLVTMTFVMAITLIYLLAFKRGRSMANKYDDNDECANWMAELWNNRKRLRLLMHPDGICDSEHFFNMALQRYVDEITYRVGHDIMMAPSISLKEYHQQLATAKKDT